MAGRLVGGSHAAQVIQCPTDGATAITRGALLRVDATVAAGGVVRLANGTDDTTTVAALFVAQETVAAAATSIRATLVAPDQLWEWDTAADTAATHVFKRHDMSTSLLVDNTATDDTTTQGMLVLLYQVGAAADRRAIFKIAHLGQVTA